jgi:catechol 2,3-dioxygenase
MHSTLIEGLRSVALEVPDLVAAEHFYTTVWNLEVAYRANDGIYLRGSGDDAYLLALFPGGQVPAIRHVTLRARSQAALESIAQQVTVAGGQLLAEAHLLSRDPAQGTGIKFSDPHGRVFQVVHGDDRAVPYPHKDRPVRLTHMVLNSHAVDATQAFLTQVLGFLLIDRTVAIAFMNCNRDHHTLAVAVADNDALNHIAFLMPDADAVMRGGGRMKDAGQPIQWGPGRHGPGNNVFNYFLDPFGVVIEYTAEVEQVDATYTSHGPEHWKWPAGRVDRWGISPPPGATLKDAQRRIYFVNQ